MADTVIGRHKVSMDAICCAVAADIIHIKLTELGSADVNFSGAAMYIVMCVMNDLKNIRVNKVILLFYVIISIFFFI